MYALGYHLQIHSCDYDCVVIYLIVVIFFWGTDFNALLCEVILRDLDFFGDEISVESNCPIF